jgi:hypothetical protein
VPEFSEDVVVVEADVRLATGNNADIVRIENSGAVTIRRGKGGGSTTPVLTFEPGDAELTVGSDDRTGRIVLANAAGAAIQLLSGTATIDVGRVDTGGDVVVRDGGGVEVIHLDGADAVVRIGASEHAGALRVVDQFDRTVLHVNAGSGKLTLGAEDDDGLRPGDLVVRGQLGRDAIRLDGRNAFVTIGGIGNEGDLRITDGNGFEAFRVDGGSGSVTVGGGNVEGDLTVRDVFGRDAVRINAENGTVTIGAAGVEGDLIVRDAVGRSAMTMNGETAELFLGDDGLEGDLIVRDAEGVDRIHLNGATGDIELMGADLAEEFAADAELPAGTVVIATGPDEVTEAVSAGDRRVVGVVSNAGDFRTALRLGARAGRAASVPVALVGRVFARAVASNGPIAIGDLLVTADLPGHAMHAGDEPRPGTVLGKALGALTNGAGLIPVLLMQR